MKNTKLQNSSLRKRKGFTLIELIVVIAILAILAAIAIPTFLGTLDRAKDNTDAANKTALQSAAQVALAENGYPEAEVTWSSTDDGAAYDALFDRDKYVAVWPKDPYNNGDDYTVTISDAGVVGVALG